VAKYICEHKADVFPQANNTGDMAAEAKEDGGAEVAPTFDWVPEGCSPLADGEYDVIVLGTGLTECILSGLMATQGRRVLHLDRNNYYGGPTASLNLTNLYKKFKGGAAPPDALGANRDWNVDLIPKFIMACGKLVKILLHTKVTRYLEFKNIEGSYVGRFSKGGFFGGKEGLVVSKVPATAMEAASTDIVGMFAKGALKKMLQYMAKYEAADASTHAGLDLSTMPMQAFYEHFGVSADVVSFVGHAMALQKDDAYLARPAAETIDAVQLYCYSLERYGRSPYIYPLYGLGGLPEGFSRLCAIHGGTFMLNRPVDEILFGDDGKAWGVKVPATEDEEDDQNPKVAKAPMIIGDPSYFSEEKLSTVGQVVRSICFLDAPIPGTDGKESVQLIIPATAIGGGRKNDIYVCMVSHAHCVAARGKFIAIASTTVETDAAGAEAELAPAFRLMGGKMLERFTTVSDLRVPANDPAADGCFISNDYDATSHFESVAEDVLRLYQQVTGEELDMSISADTVEEE